MEDCPIEGLLKQGLSSIRVDFKNTLELETQESDEYSTTIYSSTSLSKDAQTKFDIFESDPVVSGMISSITQL